MFFCLTNYTLLIKSPSYWLVTILLVRVQKNSREIGKVFEKLYLKTKYVDVGCQMKPRKHL